MKSIIFTYYSSRVADVIYHNLKSLIRNSDPYFELIVCSQVEIPSKVLKQLTSLIQTTQIYPTFAQSNMGSQPADLYSINPFITSALTYRDADLVTVFDPNTFVINRLSALVYGANRFYQTHTGQISANLFTFSPSDLVSQIVNIALSKFDFYSPSSINQFSYIISNSIAFSNKQIDTSKFIFSQPADNDTLIREKLFAVNPLSASPSQITNIVAFRANEILRNEKIKLPSTSKKGQTRSSLMDVWPMSLIASYSSKLNRIVKTPGKTVESMNPLLISYHADQPGKTYYRDFAERLKSQCDKFGVRHDIAELQSLGKYSNNCLIKPSFILNKLIQHKESIVWMDCDTSFKAPFDNFNSVTADIGMATHTGDLDGITASPIMFNYSPGAFRIIREWTVHCMSALAQGIIELDRDALKHYVLPSLGDNYTMLLLADNWKDFTNGYYIVNGSSIHENKNEVFNKVNSLSDQCRWDISKNVKRYDVIFESTAQSAFSQAYECLTNFSNTSRFRFFFAESLESSTSTVLHKLRIETGDSVFFGKPIRPDSNIIQVIASNSTSFEKNWDILWKQ